MRHFTLLSAVAGVSVAALSPASATQIDYVTVQDVGKGTKSNPLGPFPGTSSDFTFGNFLIQGLSVNATSLRPLNVQFGSDITNTGSVLDTINLFVTVTNLTSLVGANLGISTTTSANFDGSQIEGYAVSTYYDPNNGAAYSASDILLSSSAGGETTNAFLGTTAGSTASSGLFSYTVEYSLTLAPDEFASGGSTTSANVPEPAPICVVAIGLMALAMVRRQRA
jgi:hypothetical protein